MSAPSVTHLQQRIAELEKALAAQPQEDPYARFFQMTLDLACIATMDGYFKEINPSFEHVLGYSKATLLASPFLDFVHPDDVDATLAALATLSEGDPIITFDNRYRKADGTYIWLSWKSKPVVEEGLIYAIARDISATKAALASLRETQEELKWQTEMLKRAENLAHVGHWRINLVDGSLLWSDEVYRIHGQDPETFRPMLADGINAYHPDDRAYVSQVVQEAIEQGKGFSFQQRLVRPTGEIRYVESHGECQVNDSGTVETVFGIFQDITEQYQAKAALAESEMRFRLAAEGASAGIWDWLNVNESAEWWSPKFYELLGYTNGEIEPTVDTFAALLHPDDKAATFALVEQHFKGEARFVKEYRLQTKQGAYKWFLGSGQASFDATGNPVRMIGSIIDINARKKAERTLQEYAETLKRRNAELEQFAYVASHDLQEPLRTITSFIGLLEERLEGQLAGDTKEFMDFVVDAAHRMKALINDLLEYSRMGRWEINREPTDLQILASTVLHLLDTTLQEHHAEVTVGPLPTLSCDAPKVGLVLQNLIVNSIKYNESATPTVHVSAERKGKMWQFAVQDNGIGIAPQFHERIFQIFKRLHGRSSHTGTGIGLSLCQKVVERHEGRIWVESDLGQGATFFFTLPARIE